MVDGAARDRLAIAVVALFAAASLAHAAARRGVAFAGWLLAVAGGVGMGAELIGVATGWPFGEYRYTGALGPHVAGVTVVVPLAWTMMAYPALVVARHVTQRPVAGVALAAWALTAWDLFLDPQMVADGAWRWAADGAYAGDVYEVGH
ncbi:MAG: carotene biosynthesis protein, partial [Actinobacteria bacterium QS_5_72_10]